MATTVATPTVGSSLSSSPAAAAKHAFRCQLTSSNIKFSYGAKTNTLHSPLVYVAADPILSIGSLSPKWRAPRLAAMMASEEAAAVETAATEEAAEEAVEEVAQGEEKGGGDEEAVEEEVLSTKLYFGNLPYHCDSAQLAGIVQQYANPELVEVLYDRETGKSRGFAFVTMSSIEDCNAVIENLDGCEYGGRYLRVNLSDKPRKREPLAPETEHKLFVGNLSWSVTSESLYQVFQECGSVVGARVLYDGETGKSRGYGFVCYSTRSELENALASLNGVELEGRAIRVSLAQGKKS